MDQKKIDAAIGSLVVLRETRDDLLETAVIALVGNNLLPDRVNELVALVRSARTADDLPGELNSLAASLAQPTVN